MQLIPAHKITGNDKASRYVRDFCTAFDTDPVKNVSTNMWLLNTGVHQFPVSVNEASGIQNNCYVVSPLAAFTDYAIEETHRINKPLITWPIMLLIKIFKTFLHSIQIDNIVQVNNWLLSTNIYPTDWKGEDTDIIVNLLRKKFPQSAIAFRSLNYATNRMLILKLKSANFEPVPTRQVYIFDGNDRSQKSFMFRHNYKIDSNLLKKVPMK